MWSHKEVYIHLYDIKVNRIAKFSLDLNSVDGTRGNGIGCHTVTGKESGHVNIHENNDNVNLIQAHNIQSWGVTEGGYSDMARILDVQ